MQRLWREEGWGGGALQRQAWLLHTNATGEGKSGKYTLC